MHHTFVSDFIVDSVLPWTVIIESFYRTHVTVEYDYVLRWSDSTALID